MFQHFIASQFFDRIRIKSTVTATGMQYLERNKVHAKLFSLEGAGLFSNSLNKTTADNITVVYILQYTEIELIS